MNTKSFLLGLACFALAAPVQAADINWSGFMSFNAGKSLEDGTVYTVEPTTGGVYDRQLRFDPESLVGIQGQAIISDKLRGTVQLVSRGANDFNTEVEWAFLSYDLSENMTLNAGRFRHPLFYYSDFLDVGYAYHWIRPPVEVYNVPHSALEGANLYFSRLFGEVDVSTQVWYGGLDDIGLEGSDLEVQKNVGINTLISYQWFKVRLLYNETDILFNFEDPSTDPPTLVTFESPTEFLAAAFMVDVDNFIFRSEATLTKNKGVFEGETDAWYVSAGYSLGDFMPHLTHARSDAPGEAVTYTDTAGVAWNFHPSAVAKLEYSFTDVTAVDPFVFPPQPATRVDGGVVSFAIDVLF